MGHIQLNMLLLLLISPTATIFFFTFVTWFFCLCNSKLPHPNHTESSLDTAHEPHHGSVWSNTRLFWLDQILVLWYQNDGPRPLSHFKLWFEQNWKFWTKQGRCKNTCQTFLQHRRDIYLSGSWIELDDDIFCTEEKWRQLKFMLSSFQRFVVADLFLSLYPWFWKPPFTL